MMESQRTSNWILTKLQWNWNKINNNNDKITNVVNYLKYYSCISFKYLHKICEKHPKNGRTIEKTKTFQKIQKTPEKSQKFPPKLDT